MHSRIEVNNYLKAFMDTYSYSLILDSEARVRKYSGSLCELMGIPDGDPYIGESLFDLYKLLNEKNAKEASERLSRILSGDEEEIIKNATIDWPTGIKRIYRVSYRRVMKKDNDKDELDGIVLVARDITDIHLDIAGRRIKDLLVSAATPCMIWDEKGEVVDYNDEIARIFKMPADLSLEEFGKQFFALQPLHQPDGRLTEDVRQEVLQEALQNGFSQVSGRLAACDGTPIYFMINVTRIMWLFEYRLVIYYFDMTDSLIKEAKVKEANERIRLMLDSNPMACLLRDDSETIIDCNQAALDVFGVADKNELINDFHRFYPEYQPDGSSSLDKASNIFDVLRKEGSVDDFEWTFQSGDGEMLPMEVTMVRIQWEERYCFLSYLMDLRKFKTVEQDMLESAEKEREAVLRKEAAEMANEAKGEFLANMSHEIRTPMNAVLGMAELLLQENMNSRQLEYAEDIKISAMALLNIINDILDVSKIQSGKFNLIPVHYDFDVLIDNIASIIQFLIDVKNVSFKLNIQDHPHLYLYGDDVRLRQVLLNLLSNAVKFTDEGYIQLSIGFSDTSVKITVSDTGIGIPAENIPTLFDAFEQADAHNNRNTKGTGLGLTISKSIIEMMGGKISVESVYGQGTSFYCEIPKILGDGSSVNVSNNKEAVIYAPNAKVLVVDDNRTNLSVAAGLLQICQITADTATSGKQAIELAQQKDYDIIFMDHRMPDMNGTETTKIIRESGITAPIIALTASVITGAKEKMLSAGMSDYLSKPIVKSELMRMLKKWIPADKIKEKRFEAVISQEVTDENHNKFWDTIEHIEGLDLATGLDRVDGQRDVYEKTLKLMIHEIEKSNENLNYFLSSGNMEGFCVEVHGIKGAMASVGATALSERAHELEKASERTDVAFCESNLPSFLEDILKFNARLKEAFSIISRSDVPNVIPPELPPIFERMKNAFDDVDLVLIDEEIENLDALNLSGALKERTEQIKDAVMMMDYDGATAYINQLLNGG